MQVPFGYGTLDPIAVQLMGRGPRLVPQHGGRRVVLQMRTDWRVRAFASSTYEIVGLARNAIYQRLREAPRPLVYLAAAQTARPGTGVRRRDDANQRDRRADGARRGARGGSDDDPARGRCPHHGRYRRRPRDRL
jgi:hypothetical protein